MLLLPSVEGFEHSKWAKVMARKAALSAEALADLGAQKLAELILVEARDNAAFRKRVNAALAGVQGGDAVAALIDRRLAALEKARSAVDWRKEKDFAADLKATAETITGDLAALDPPLAMERLVRFLGSHARVFERVDDSSGRLQDVYWQAAGQVPELLRQMPAEGLSRVPAWLLAGLTRDTHGLIAQAAVESVRLLPGPVLAEWDQALSRDKEPSDAVLAVRQSIAETRGDLEAYIALEEQLPEWRRDPLRIAEKLLEARRLDEALDWARREKRGGIAFMSAADLANGRITRPYDFKRVALEARILEAKNDRPAAQTLRWSTFEKTLHAGTLRSYIAKLDDFQEFDELDRAFAIAEAFQQPYVALAFFIEWPRLDCAAKLVLDKRALWDGRHYDVLAGTAATLEADYPVAATILYRINDILVCAKSPAYGHGARYLAKLSALAEEISDGQGVEDHTTYSLALKRSHGRKHGFWTLVDSGSEKKS